MRFYLDEHLSPTIAQIARGLGLDVVSCQELRREGLSDDEQLRPAAQDRRCLVTKDRDDFARLTSQFLVEGRPHAGVVVVPPSMRTDQFTRIAQALRTYADRHGDAPTDYLFDYLR